MAADLRKGRTDLIRVNTDLEARRKYMETVPENVAAGEYFDDAKGKVTTINNSAVRLLGIVEKEPLGRPLLDVLPWVSGAAVGIDPGTLLALPKQALSSEKSPFPSRKRQYR